MPNEMNRLKRGGFTLVEILLGVMIFGILSTTIYGVFANAIRLNRQARNIEELYRDARCVIDALTLDLENMVPYTTSREFFEKREVIVKEATRKNVTITQKSITGLMEEDAAVGSFIGQEQSLAMVVPQADGLKEVVYYLQPPQQTRIYQSLINRFDFSLSTVVTQSEDIEEDLYFLIREERPFPYQDLDEIASGIHEEVVGSYILADSLRFSYLGQGRDREGEPDWVSEWAESEQPSVLRFEATFVLPHADRRLSVDKKIRLPFIFTAGPESFGEFSIN